MRITQSMVMNSYTNRLGKVFADMDTATQKVITKRNFLTAKEDPAGAARAYQLRRNFQQTNDYLENSEEVMDMMDSLDASTMVISNMATHIHTTIESGRNGTWALEDRQILANEIRSMMKTAVDSLNAKFDDKFLFGGSSTKQLPFELDMEASPPKLTFRGIDVTSTDPKDQARLQELASEKIYVDMGYGLDVSVDENGFPVVKDSSAFNISNPGLTMLGFGPLAEDNLILNMGKIADELEREPLDYDASGKLWAKLDVQRQNVLNSVTQLGSDYQFLENRISVLKQNSDSLNEKISDVEYIDMEVAITNMKMADYVYRAALEMGTKILTPSFIDFMN